MQKKCVTTNAFKTKESSNFNHCTPHADLFCHMDGSNCNYHILYVCNDKANVKQNDRKSAK